MEMLEIPDQHDRHLRATMRWIEQAAGKGWQLSDECKARMVRDLRRAAQAAETCRDTAAVARAMAALDALNLRRVEIALEAARQVQASAASPVNVNVTVANQVVGESEEDVRRRIGEVERALQALDGASGAEAAGVAHQSAVLPAHTNGKANGVPPGDKRP